MNSIFLPAHGQTSAATPVAPSTIYAIGVIGPCGGIVFDITNGGLKGLEAAPSDQAGPATWDTAMALVASNNTGGCNDWYLPSQGELNMLYQQRGIVGGFSSGIYHSSTEIGAGGLVWGQNFTTDSQIYYAKPNTLNSRAIRAF